jgi:hypothetical protein
MKAENNTKGIIKNEITGRHFLIIFIIIIYPMCCLFTVYYRPACSDLIAYDMMKIILYYSPFAKLSRFYVRIKGWIPLSACG